MTNKQKLTVLLSESLGDGNKTVIYNSFEPNKIIKYLNKKFYTVYITDEKVVFINTILSYSEKDDLEKLAKAVVENLLS